jgi:hypothetical protein
MPMLRKRQVQPDADTFLWRESKVGREKGAVEDLDLRQAVHRRWYELGYVDRLSDPRAAELHRQWSER